MTNRIATDSGWKSRSLVTAAGMAVALCACSALGAGPETGAVGAGGGGGVVDAGGQVGFDAPRVMRVPQGKGAWSFRIQNVDAEHTTAEKFINAARVADTDPVITGYEFFSRVTVRAANTAAAVEAVEAFGRGIAAEVSIENLAGLEGTTVFQTASVGDAIRLAQSLQGRPGVKHVELEMTQPRQTRGGIPSDTLAPLQWHLENAVNPDGDHNLAAVYAQGLNGAGITIGVLEPDGTPFQVNHPELNQNYDANISMILDPLIPRPAHGTSVAGLIAAKANGEGMVGVAPNARLVALSNGSTVLEAMAHQWKNGITHVKNNSWGPGPYGGAQIVPEGEFFPAFIIPTNTNTGDLFGVTNVGLAIEAGAEHGRANKGVAYVWAAGNSSSGLPLAALNVAPGLGLTGATNSIGLPSGDFNYGGLGVFNIAAHPFFGHPNFFGIYTTPFWPMATFGPRTEYDGYLNAQGTIAIAAVTENNAPSGYSTMGTAVFAAAYSAPDAFYGQSGRSVFTTDALNDFTMYDPSSVAFGSGFTGFFGGTSAAAPIASGIVGLIMGANPRLTMRDIRHIIERTAVRVSFDWVNGINEYYANGGMNTALWQPNGAFQVEGRVVAHSDAVGFGIIDAEAAVELAMVWPGLPRQLVLERRRNEDNDDGMPIDIPDATLEETAEMQSTAVPGEAQVIGFCVPYDYVIEEIELIIDGEGNSPGDIFIALVSPHGTISPLHLPHIDNSAGFIDGQEAAFIENRFLSYKHWGEPSGGDWALIFQDFRPNEELDEGEIDEDTMEVIDYVTQFPMYGNIPTLPGNPDAEEVTITEYTLRIYGYDAGRVNPNLCENRFNSFCPYDINADGKVTPEDLFLFIELWQNFEPVGDWDRDGDWDFNDVYLFFIGWQPGFCQFDGGDDADVQGGGTIRPGDGNGNVRPI